MTAGLRLVAFAVLLGLVFAASFLAGAVLGPDRDDRSVSAPAAEPHSAYPQREQRGSVHVVRDGPGGTR